MMMHPHFHRSEFDTYAQGASDETVTIHISRDKITGELTAQIIASGGSGVGCSLRLKQDQAETLRDMLTDALASQYKAEAA
jgi:hypothetical protein